MDLNSGLGVELLRLSSSLATKTAECEKLREAACALLMGAEATTDTLTSATDVIKIGAARARGLMGGSMARLRSVLARDYSAYQAFDHTLDELAECWRQCDETTVFRKVEDVLNARNTLNDACGEKK